MLELIFNLLIFYKLRTQKSIRSKIVGKIMLRCHSERSEESCSIGSLQILRSAKNAELRMTESPSIFEGILKKY